MRKLIGSAVGFALSIAIVLPAAADFGGDILVGLDIPTRDDSDEVVESPDFSFPGDDDGDDGDDGFFFSLPDDYDGVGDAAREDAQSLTDPIRERVGIGSDD
jgi:hypothetical protein